MQILTDQLLYQHLTHHLLVSGSYLSLNAADWKMEDIAECSGAQQPAAQSAAARSVTMLVYETNLG